MSTKNVKTMSQFPLPSNTKAAEDNEPAVDEEGAKQNQS